MPLLLSGAMLVTVSMPCIRERWSLFAFGVLGGGNTCLLRDSASTSASSMRLSFERFLRAIKQEALTDTQTGIPIGMIAHLACLAHHQRGTRGISFGRLACIVAHNLVMAAMAFSGRIARVYTAGDDLLVPCLILAIAEDAALHPVGAFGVAPARVPALFRLEIAQVLKNEKRSSMLSGELDNARTHQMGKRLITVSELAPEGGIVLLVFRQDASLATVDCNTSQLALPKARYLSATADEAGSEDGAFDSLDGADGNLFTQIEINGADLRFRVSDLFYCFGWYGEGLFERGMQPPLLPMPDELGTSQLKPCWQIAGQGADFDPAPARSGPDFERDAVLAPVPPLSRVEGSRLVPGARRNRRALPEWLLLFSRACWPGFVLLLTRPPLFERGEEGASRAKCRIDSGASEHGRDIWRDLRKCHDGCRVRLRGMGESFQGRERLSIGEGKHTLMSLDDFKVEGDNTIKESMICREVVGMLCPVVQCRSYRAGRLCHVCFLLALHLWLSIA